MRWTFSVSLLFLIVLALPAADDKQQNYQFDNADLGKLPAGWKTDQTGKGEGSVWKIIADDTAPSKRGFVLAQLAESPGGLFNLCVVAETNYKDVDVRISFKAIRGRNDQGGGIVWRYQDANNYYVARMNPLEDNLRFYKVVAGKRTQLANKENIQVATGEWHTIKVTMKEDHVECFLDGNLMIESKDPTFTVSGIIGLWTKSDAQTNFDDLTVREK